MVNLQLDNFNFILKDSLIAQHPLANRDDSKMLHIQNTLLQDMYFYQLTELLKPNDLLIFNNTKVIPTRLLASHNNKQFNITLHKQLNKNIWLGFIKNSKKLKLLDVLTVANNFNIKIINKLSSGEIEVELLSADINNDLQTHGFMPLPPYIKRNYNNANNSDNERYQSVFASVPGAVASPTASLHFTNNLLNKISTLNIKTAFVTLHVGAGTFLPVKTNNITEHKMHSEFGELPQLTINAITQTKQQNGRVIAVGTTSLRILEYVFKQHNKLVEFKGDIDLFIYPPYNFKIVDCLITNFHLPKSTLFMLVCAFGGIDNLKNAYNYAIQKNYRFFSYGDACFIEKFNGI